MRASRPTAAGRPDAHCPECEGDTVNGVGQKTAGDLMFEQYLREHGYAAVEHEPDLGVAKRPDYVIERAGTRCVVEVKMFDAATRSFPDQPFGTTNAETVMKPVRSQLREAARQLKPLAGSGLPLVVLLTNPHEAMVFLDEHHMVYAMYGDPIVVIDIDPEVGGAVGDPRHEVGRNGRLARDHQYISAVAVLSEREHAADFYDEMNRRYADLPADARWERIEDATTRGERQSGSYHRVRVFKTLSPSAAPLPGVFFEGPHDELFEPNEEGTAYIQARGKATDGA
jgi:hypothetical protein